MSELRINNITDRAGSSGPIIAGVSTVASKSHMVMPSGPTEMRGGRGRMVTYGGAVPDYLSNMNSIEIASTGGGTDFGDASANTGFGSGMGSSTRGVFKQGRGPGFSSTLEFVKFSSLGGVAEFGTDMGTSQDSSAPASDGTRGILGNGTSYNAKIQFITLASIGDTTEFGDLLSGRYMGGGAGGASPTRGFFFGGLVSGSPVGSNLIEFVTIQTLGNSVEFGNLTVGRRSIAAVTNATRAVSCSGDTPATNTMDFITMASQGNATDFGDIANQAAGYGAGGSTQIRGVITGCSPSPDATPIDFITFSTTGNATDFGDTTYGSYLNGACSDSHGGLTL